jgi:adenosyl cobinamide kinase/adenosyl cobinamide phosphate guanylyltransferase
VTAADADAARTHVTVLLGGVRSGKSARAVALARAAAGGGRVLFVATAEALDDDMASRIAAHRAERPPDWDTLEAPLDLAGDLARAFAAGPEPYAVVVIDCLTLWVSNLLLSLPDPAAAEQVVRERTAALLSVCRAGPRAARWILVSNEVGLGVVPTTPLGRRYRDALGRANQLAAAEADAVTLMVAGLALPLKP